MVVCKYFLQGNCRFGSKCRYEHSDRSYDINSGGRYKGRNEDQQYSPNNDYIQNTSANSMREVLQIVVSELLQSEKGGQWPLSCFAPIKERGCYPGIEDYSPEEIRWLIYEASKVGNVEDCKRQIQELYSSYKLKKQAILNPNAETLLIIENLFKGQIPQTTPYFSTTINSAPSVSQSLPSFSFNLAQHGIQSTNLFGGSAQQFVQPNSSVPCLFGNFRNPAVQVPSANNQMPQTSASTMAMFNVNSPNVPQDFQHLKVPDNTFESSVHSKTFPLQQTHENYQEKGVYTPIEDLTEDEKNIFKMQTFNMGQVPIKPPAKELCL